MYKKALSSLLVINILFVLGFLCVGGVGFNKSLQVRLYESRMDALCLADSKSSSVEIASVADSGQRIVDYKVVEKAPDEELFACTEKEYEVLCRLVEAEAGSEDEEGKLLVANVVLNRVESEQFPDSITEVVFQQDNGVTQFSPVANGSYSQVCISEATCAAVGRALRGEDISQGALYFAAREHADAGKMRWFDTNLTFLFQHGGHEFFR